MKKAILILPFITIYGLIYSQKDFGFSFSISNQGQIDKVLEDFYFPASPTANQDDATYGRDYKLKFNSTFFYVISRNIILRARFGIGFRNNYYEQDAINTVWQFKDKQNVYEITPSLGYIKEFEFIKFNFGFEIPMYIIGKYTQSGIYSVYPDSVNLSQEVHSFVKMSGGVISGLNTFINIDYYFTTTIYLFSEFNSGILFANLGRIYSFDYNEVYPSQISASTFYEKKYRKVYFSDFQIQFGIGIKF